MFLRARSTDSSRCICEILNFFGSKISPEDLTFPVGEPLLEHPVPADLVVPDGGRDVAPEGLAVEVYVERRVTEDAKDL